MGRDHLRQYLPTAGTPFARLLMRCGTTAIAIPPAKKTQQGTPTVNLVCSECGSVNRVPESKFKDKPVCGKCKSSLLPTHPVDLSADLFAKFITRTDLPVLVDFWAPWCGPCRMMAPAFATAAEELSPQVILAKVNTEDAPQISSQYGISGIPTMILFKSGNELTRQSGAINTQQIVAFARQG